MKETDFVYQHIISFFMGFFFFGTEEMKQCNKFETVRLMFFVSRLCDWLMALETDLLF